MHRRIASLICWQALAWLVCWLGGTLAPQHSPEDLTIYQVAQRGAAHTSFGAHYRHELAIDRTDANRFRPIYITLLTAYVRYSGTELWLWNGGMALLLGLTGWLLNRWLLQLGFTPLLASLGGILCIVGPQAEAWQLFTYQEGLAMPLWIAALTLIPYTTHTRNTLRLASSAMLLLLAGATKEVFLLTIPFWCMIAGGTPLLPRYSGRWWALSLLLCGYMLGMLLYIRTTVSTTHAGVYGFSLWQTTPGRLFTAVAQLLGQSYGAWIAALTLTWGAFLLQKRTLSPAGRWLLSAAGILIVPQILIYTLSGFEWPRYFLPANLGLCLLVLVPLQSLKRRLSHKLRVTTITALTALLAWHGIHYLRIWSNYAQGIYRVQAQVLTTVPADSQVLWALSCPDAPFELPYWLSWYHIQRPEAPAAIVYKTDHLQCSAEDSAELQRIQAHFGYQPPVGQRPEYLFAVSSLHGVPWKADIPRLISREIIRSTHSGSAEWRGIDMTVPNPLPGKADSLVFRLGRIIYTKPVLPGQSAPGQ
ncbi:MAG: hypothetical protein KF690_11235 [Bacteroidetes bacterium]|nr:hypothetical protein [Bacteroidota bacterium]